MSICYVCKKSHEESPQGLTNGKPSGICKSCRSSQRKARYWKDKGKLKRKGRVIQANSLFMQNQATAEALKPGIYKLAYRYPTSAKYRPGYLVIRPDSMFLALWERRYWLYPSLAGIALMLANENILITDKPVEPKIHDRALGWEDFAHDPAKHPPKHRVEDLCAYYDDKFKEQLLKQADHVLKKMQAALGVNLGIDREPEVLEEDAEKLEKVF